MEHDKHSNDGIVTGGSTNSDGEAKAGTKRKRPISTSRSKRLEDVPWTATRCNRVLRTITSRINILRRLSENNFADKAAARQSPAKRKPVLPDSVRRVSPDAVDKLGTRLAALPALESPMKGNDPEWIPDTGRKSAKRTYSARGRPRKVKIEEPLRSRAHDASFRSPFIKRILRPEAADSPLNVRSNGQMRSKERQIALQPNSHAERALRTLLDSFETLLITTAPSVPAPRRGAGSLRDMCLRRVPEYVDFEQKYAEDEEDYDYDATEAVYVDLEKLGDGGWNGLRKVVRAHAVKFIVDAMDDRTWPHESLDALIDICDRNLAVAEGQQILSAWFLRSDGVVSERLGRFLDCCTKLDCLGFMFTTLREMLNDGLVQHSEFSRCPQLWLELLKALARRSSRADAAAFFEAYVIASIRADCDPNICLNGEAMGPYTQESVVVVITALCWNNDNGSASETAIGSLSQHLHRMAIAACQSSDLLQGTTRVCTGEHLQKAHRSAQPLLLSSLVTYAIHSKTVEDEETVGLGSLIQALVDGDRLVKQTSNYKEVMSDRACFVCDVAKCIAMFNPTAAKDMTKDVVTGLVQLCKHVSTAATTLLQSFAVEIALAWAEYRGDNESYAFAEDIENTVLNASPLEGVIHTPGSSSKPKRFRWEEGLCEFIRATPLPSMKRERIVTDLAALEGDSSAGMDTPESPLRKQSSRTVEKVSKLAEAESTDLKPTQTVRKPQVLADEVIGLASVVKSSVTTTPACSPSKKQSKKAAKLAKEVFEIAADPADDMLSYENERVPASPTKSRSPRKAKQPKAIPEASGPTCITKPIVEASPQHRATRTPSVPSPKLSSIWTIDNKGRIVKTDPDADAPTPTSPTKDELAVTPHKARSWSEDAAMRMPRTEPPLHQVANQRDELAMTPGVSKTVERDELAMSPVVQRKSRLPLPTKSHAATTMSSSWRQPMATITHNALPPSSRLTRSRSKHVDVDGDELGV